MNTLVNIFELLELKGLNYNGAQDGHITFKQPETISSSQISSTQ